MKVLVPLEAKGAGTPYAESCHSLLQRVAAAHNVSFTRLLALLKGMSAKPSRAKAANLAASLAGVGEQTRELVATYRELSGAPDLTGHTLLHLANVISPRANGVFSVAQKWCPVCIHPDRGTGYGMFAHVLKQVHSCRLHEVALEGSCPKCHRSQSYMASLWLRPHCIYCRTPLWSEVARRIEATNAEAWAEGQLYELVSYLSDCERPKPNGPWMAEAVNVLQRLGTETCSPFSGFEARLLRRPPEHGFKLPNLLWLAANCSSTLVDVILRPREALGGVLPLAKPVLRESFRRCAVPVTCWAAFEELVQRLLDENEAWRPTLDTLSALTGAGVLYNRNREMALRYNSARAFEIRGPVASACDREFTVMMLGELPDKRVNHRVIERILAKKPMELPPALMARVSKAVELACVVLGRRVDISAERLGSVANARAQMRSHKVRML